MTAVAHDTTTAGFQLDRAAHTVRFRRVVPATPQEVFDAWTKPEEVSAWWDPDGKPLVRCEIDLKPGGSFTFVNAGHTAQPFTGTYREITPPTLLAFDALGAEGRVELTDQDGTTEMLVEIVCSSAEHLEHFVRLGVADGTARTLDNLVGFASRQQA